MEEFHLKSLNHPYWGNNNGHQQTDQIFPTGVHTKKLNMPKSSSLKCTFGRSGIDYRVASLFTRYPTAKGIIP